MLLQRMPTRLATLNQVKKVSCLQSDSCLQSLRAVTISLTLTGKGAIAFARELSERLLAEKSQKVESNVNNQEELIPKSEVMKMLSVSSTTLWLWNNNKYLPQINIGRKVFYRAEDIQKLRKGNTNEDSGSSI